MTGKSHAATRLHLLGIRHHGPGSARGVLAALQAADPAIVLIEGPPDADDMIPFAASPAMRPPLALLVHAQDEPANSSFYPFAEYSPEWQAIRWALASGRPVRFIDLPAAVRLARRAQPAAAATPATAKPEDGTSPHDPASDAPDSPDTPAEDPSASLEPDAPTDDIAPGAAEEALRIRRDPLAYLAEIAGYDDSEAWWNALIEQGVHGPEIFLAIERAIGALRERLDAALTDNPASDQPDADRLEREREAHMRLAIADALKETDGPVAVVCGAWHVPALRAKVPARDDRALLKGLPKLKVVATWVPWTETRLASGSGYGAGVESPGWYAHLWSELQRADRSSTEDPLAPDRFASRWQSRAAALLRARGRPASTASVIEAARLSLALAGLRDLALPGLTEMQEATLATLCEGEPAPLRLIETELVIGGRVGEIDEAVPQMPLAADLARWQKKLKLKPEALDQELSLDLRSEAGLAKSLLLHRLRLVHVPWGTPTGSGTSRGTFRENWLLKWEPEFSVRLAEALVWGTTVEQAAGNAAVAAAERAVSLQEVSSLVRDCLDAGLAQAAERAIAILQGAAAQSSDTGALAAAVPPLASILRYGTAREMPIAPLRLLVTSLVETVCAGLVYACRNLQAEEAGQLRDQLRDLDEAIPLLDDEVLAQAWSRALQAVANDAAPHPALAGFCVRRLYDQSTLSTDATALHLSRALSPSVSPAAAGDWLDGFLGNSGQILLHDHALRSIIDRWIVALGEEELTNLLPMLRRAFASFDRSERRRLLDEILRTRTPVDAGSATAVAATAADADDAPGFTDALPLLLTILGARPVTPEDTPS